jgi:hypothetical protein
MEVLSVRLFLLLLILKELLSILSRIGAVFKTIGLNTLLRSILSIIGLRQGFIE